MRSVTLPLAVCTVHLPADSHMMEVALVTLGVRSQVKFSSCWWWGNRGNHSMHSSGVLFLVMAPIGSSSPAISGFPLPVFTVRVCGSGSHYSLSDSTRDQAMSQSFGAVKGSGFGSFNVSLDWGG